jgi:hypothetical protein
MIRTYTLTDQNTGAVAVGIDSAQIAATLRPWFAGDYDQAAEVASVIEELETRVRRGEYYGEQEAYLGVTVTVED